MKVLWKKTNGKKKITILISFVVIALAVINKYWIERPIPLQIPEDTLRTEKIDLVDDREKLTLSATETVQSFFYFLKNGDIESALSHFTTKYQLSFYKNEKKMKRLKDFADEFEEIKLSKVEQTKQIIRMNVEIKTTKYNTKKHMIELHSNEPNDWLISNISNWPL